MQSKVSLTPLFFKPAFKFAFKFIFSILTFTLFSNQLLAQQNLKPNLIHGKPGHNYHIISVKDSIHVVDSDMAEMVNIIVEYKNEPMFVQQQKNALRKVSASSFQAMQVQFSNDLSRIYNSANKAFSTTLPVPQKKREYYKVFNGVSLTVPKAMVGEIASLPYVKKVHKEKTVKADLKESVKIIGADSVWNKYNDQGDSVVVGIIDTGIDYMHPALGGGFGKGYKVIGGYDFVNKDNDPMDDHGHGTHVAGIVAGDCDSIKGVAPKALLAAFKVLDDGGSGFESDIIAAIEMTVDPNGDDNMEDKLDVVNMSLGSSVGNAFDAMSEAVNNAVKLGVTFCIAAGNNGSYDINYFVGSPGTAELAITVGASDKADKLAKFSSKGPAKRSYAIKPEVVAPGVDIYSSFLNGTYEHLSGTSMATPMVAGVCALLKHKHHDWSPQMIKSALMSSAKDLGLDVMVQGAGRINAMKAMNVKSMILPDKLNFGLDSLSLSLFTKTDTITIINYSAVQQDYQISITGLPQGIILQPDQNSLSILPGGSKQVLFNLKVDNKTVQNGVKPSYSYSGKVRIIGTADTLSVPWAFTKSPVLIVEFDQPVYYYTIFNKTNSYDMETAWQSDDLWFTEHMLPEDKYNVLSFLSSTQNVIYNNYVVMKKDLQINSVNKVSVSYKEADKTVSFNGVDESGRLLNNLGQNEKNIFFAQTYQGGSNLLFGIPLYDNMNINVSDMPDYISIFGGQFQKDLLGEHKIRIVTFPLLKGTNENIVFKNIPQEYFKQSIKITLPSDADKIAAMFSNNINLKLDSILLYTESILRGYNYITEKNWEGTLYLTPTSVGPVNYSTGIVCWDTVTYDTEFFTESFRIKSDSIMCFNWKETPDIFRSWNNGAMYFGDGPVYPYWEYSLAHWSPNEFRLSYPIIYGQMRESRPADRNRAIYTIYDSQNNIVIRDSLNVSAHYNIPKGKYKYQFTDNNYTVAGRRGKATLLSDIDEHFLREPVITTLRVLNSSGTPVSMLKTGDNGKISFSVRSRPDNENDTTLTIDTAETKLFLKKNQSHNWEEIKITKRSYNKFLGVINTAEIGKYAYMDSALIDMKIVSQYTDNLNMDILKTEYTLEPAFAVGNYIYTAVEDRSNAVSAVPKEYKLNSNYPNPFNPSTTISYALPKESRVELKIYDILGRKVTDLVNDVQQAGEYKVLFNGSSLPSGIYIYSIHAGDYIASRKLMLLK